MFSGIQLYCEFGSKGIKGLSLGALQRFYYSQWRPLPEASQIIRDMLNEMETSTRPWEGAGNMMAIGRKVCRGDRPPVASGAAGRLVARCWAVEPAARPTMEQVMRELSQLA